MRGDRRTRRWAARLLVPAALALGAVAVLAVVLPLTGPRENATPSPPVPPALGTDATSPDQLHATLAAMGRTSISWNVSYMADTDALDVGLLDAEVAAGVTHHVVTVEMWSLEGEQGVLRKIAAGAVDANLRAVAEQMRAWQDGHPGQEVVVRPLHEANLPSYPWGFGAGNENGNQPGDFAPAWRRIVGVMRAAAPGLRFFLCPNGGDAHTYDWGVPADEVDYVGHDRYNRSQESDDWSTPDQVHDTTIREIQKVYPGKPYVIAETATSQPGHGVTGHSKAEWFAELARWMKGPAARAGVVAVCYFDHDKTAVNGNDWRIFPAGAEGADQSRRAFRGLFADFR